MGNLVLIVDDEVITRQMLATLLKIDGYESIEAEDGLDALEKVENHAPDAIILDVMMPRMDGVTACKHLRSNPKTASIPILMLSGRTQIEAEEEGLNAGANVYLKKPMDIQKMLATLKNILPQQPVAV
jgi:DNA-binding response OmpR family regulator